MRERPSSCSRNHQSSRITPAYAGKTLVHVDDIVAVEDHPRVCGKDDLLVMCYGNTVGSPPRMRERLTCAKTVGMIIRITPAYAGKTR